MNKNKKRKTFLFSLLFVVSNIFASIILHNCGEGRKEENSEMLGEINFKSGQIVFRGRVFLLRGVNLGEELKRPPFFPEGLTKGVMEDIASAGMNIIRLIVVWEGIEPEKDKIDTRYISRIKEIIKWADEYGIFVLVDFHQDVFSRKFGGDGAPFWAVIDEGIPFEKIDPWYLNYSQPAVLKSFENFYKNTNGIQDEFLDAVRELIKNLKDLNNIIGFEPMNEPFPPKLDFSDEYLSEFERELLIPFYNKFLNVLEEEGFLERGILFFFEPAVPRTTFISPSSGFSTAFPTDWVRKNFVFAPHIYEPEITIEKEYRSIRDKMRRTVENLFRESERLGIPMWVGEFGIEKKPNYLSFFDDILPIFDEFRIGWAVWTYTVGEHTMSFHHYKDTIRTPTASHLPCNIESILKRKDDRKTLYEFELDCVDDGEGIFNFPAGSTWWSEPPTYSEQIKKFSVKFKFSREQKYKVFFSWEDN